MRSFLELFNSNTESEIDDVLRRHKDIFNENNWKPYGGNESNCGTFENQQADPVPVEKITNSLMLF